MGWSWSHRQRLLLSTLKPADSRCKRFLFALEPGNARAPRPRLLSRRRMCPRRWALGSPCSSQRQRPSRHFRSSEATAQPPRLSTPATEAATSRSAALGEARRLLARRRLTQPRQPFLILLAGVIRRRGLRIRSGQPEEGGAASPTEVVPEPPVVPEGGAVSEAWLRPSNIASSCGANLMHVSSFPRRMALSKVGFA